jgi:hypothetical protein
VGGKEEIAEHGGGGEKGAGKAGLTIRVIQLFL